MTRFFFKLSIVTPVGTFSINSALNTIGGFFFFSEDLRWSRRAKEYEDKINSGDPKAIAEVVRDLHRNANQPEQSYSERQIYESALDRLLSELSAVESVDLSEAMNILENHLKNQPNKTIPNNAEEDTITQNEDVSLDDNTQK